MSALVLTSVVEDVAQKATQERHSKKVIRTCRCGTEFILLEDHPGGYARLCRKCANKRLRANQWKDNQELVPGDLVIIGATDVNGHLVSLAQLFHFEVDPAVVEKALKEDPLYTRLGVVIDTSDISFPTVRSLRFPDVQIPKYYSRGIVGRKYDSITKVGRMAYDGTHELYTFGAFVISGLAAERRSDFLVKVRSS